MTDNLIKINIEGDSIIIRCKIDDLIYIVENDPTESYKVIDKKLFAKDFINELENSTPYNGTEGINAIEDLFESTYHSVYTSASDSIINENEDL